MSQKSTAFENKFNSVYALGILAAISFFIFLVNSDIAIEYMKKGLKLCASTVIPSLFPFMIISELLISSGLGVSVGRLLSKPVSALFGIGEGSACAFLLGSVCGFPIGAKAVSSLLERGEISKNEAERALTFCNNPGSAFIVSSVGISLFGSAKLGWLLYGSLLISALLVGSVGRLFFVADIKNSHTSTVAVACKTDGAELFTNAIKSSSISMLTVCALVTFFSSLIGCLNAILEVIGASGQLCAAIFCIFELSSGVGAAAELSTTPAIAIILSSAALGWSGLSVHLQVMAVIGGKGLSFKPYFIAKAAQGILCAAITAAALKFLPFSEEVFKEIDFSAVKGNYTNAAFVCFIFFFVSILPIFVHKSRLNPCKKSKHNFF